MRDRVFTIRLDALLGIGLLALAFASCGGSSGGPGPEGDGQGLTLINFLQAGQDSVPINKALEFHFSEAVDGATVNDVTMQVREGPGFGDAAAGTYITEGNIVRFAPDLPTICGYTDGGFAAGKTYRVTLVGSPEYFCIKNSVGEPLGSTANYEFSTLPDTDPDVLEDQIPGAAPDIVGVTPEPGSAAVGVADVTEIDVEFTENLDPCSIRLGETIFFRAYEQGDPDAFLEAPNGNDSGFDPVEDALPGDPYTWGANGTPIAPPREIAVNVSLEQTRSETVLHVHPLAGMFPENLLLVLDLTNGIKDFGGTPFPGRSISFTMENVDGFSGALTLEYDATTPIELGQTSADVDTPRSPGRAQAWLAFTGDGDNGNDAPYTFPAFPIFDGGGNYVSDDYRDNDDEEDDLIVEGLVTLNTGGERTPAAASNRTDGSSASVWEFRRVEIRSGGVLRLIGVNPAIFVVKEDVVIQAGGSVEAYGGDGVNSAQGGFAGNPNAGGSGRVGGGDGGHTPGSDNSLGSNARGYLNAPIPPKSWDGVAPYGSPDFGVEGGAGAGEGGSSGTVSATYCQTSGGGQGGGGGGHAEAGEDAEYPPWAGSTWDVTDAGDGGAVVPTGDNKMRKPSAGGGGGGGGTETFYAQNSTGGGGGAGGGFVGFTAGGDITINGTIDVHGGRGGYGGWDDDGTCNGSHSGGGGGGAGGGIRLLSGGDLDLSGALLNAAGGTAGIPGCRRGGATGWSGPVAGDGADGRIVLEDRDGVITGAPALVRPATSPGYYTGRLDPSRFPGGGGGGSGGAATAVTQPIPLGTIVDPTSVVVLPLERADIVAGIPGVAAPNDGSASIVIEIEGFDANPDGTLDPSSGTGWYAAGFLTDSGSETQPSWTPDQAPPGFPVDAGQGVAGLSGSAFVRVRLTLFVAAGMTPEDPGPWVDRLTLRYTYDN